MPLFNKKKKMTEFKKKKLLTQVFGNTKIQTIESIY